MPHCEQERIQKAWFAIFKVKVTARAHMIKIYQLHIFAELLILLSQDVIWRNGIVVF